MSDVISIHPDCRDWAVCHRGSVLGYAKSRAEALSIGEGLVAWLISEGRHAEVVEQEPRSFSPQPDRKS